MKKFCTFFSIAVSVLAIPVALVFKYPEKSRELGEKASDKGKKYSEKVLKKFKKKCSKCDCD